MHLSRLRELKIALAVLLPYTMLAVGSEFAHNHAGKGQRPRPACHRLASVFTAPTAAESVLSAASTAAHGRNCPACAWAMTNVSRGPVVLTAALDDTISGSITPESCGRVSGQAALHSSRGPPSS